MPTSRPIEEIEFNIKLVPQGERGLIFMLINLEEIYERCIIQNRERLPSKNVDMRISECVSL
jgi:hypothetical protein